MLSPTDQRAAVRQVRREPRRFVFSRFDLVTEDWEREGIMHVTAIDEVTGLCWTLGAPLWWDSPQYCPAYMSAYVVDELLAAVPSGTIVLTVEIGRASCRERCVSTCRSRGSRDM